MDNVLPEQAIMGFAEAGAKKAVLPIKEILLKSILAGAFLGIATVLAFTGTSQTGLGLIGALIFPVGFIMLSLLGLELVTGNFATIPVAVLHGQAKLHGLAINWSISFLGNLLGSVLFAVFFYIIATNFGNDFSSDVVKRIQNASIQKTIFYRDLGIWGYVICISKAILCNWMVTTGVLMMMISKSTTGKILATWLPIFTFFALGYEHSVVNMFVIPSGILLNANVSVADWWIYNQIPVTLGNCIGGFFLTGLSLHYCYKPKKEMM